MKHVWGVAARWVPAAAALGLIFAMVPMRGAHAASVYDPALHWRTIVTPRFRVHYPDGSRNLAVRIARIAESELDRVAELFGYRPEGRIDIVLSDASDAANGSAQVLPKTIVRLFLAAPTELTGLAAYDDWLRILVIHELAHICDIDQTWGDARLLRAIFGKYIQMNGFTPQFLSEGVAVFAETQLTATGRGRSSYVDALLRMAALEDRFVRVDQAHVQYADWPGSTAAYFYGGHFHLWLARRYGAAKVRELHQYYASMLVPYLYWPGAESVFAKSLPDLWDEWRQEEKQRAAAVKAKVEAVGVTPSRRITWHGRNLTGARYSPDASFIIYSRASPVDGATVRRVSRDGGDDRHIVLETFSPRFSFSPDGGSFFYAQNAVNERFNDYADLYRYDFAEGDGVKLKNAAAPGRSLRARDPDLSPDGERLVFVQGRLHQSWVSIARITGDQRDQLAVKTLVGPHGDMQHASPRFSPDGRQVALSTWFEDGRRDIVLVDAESGDLMRRVTADAALDGNPAWSPDGRYLLYESDADGISNIYAFDRRDEVYFRVTQVVGGAFQPDVARNGSSLLFRNLSGAGFDIHEMPFDPSRWQPLAYVPAQGYTPAAPATAVSGEWVATTWPSPVWRDDEPALALATGEEEIPYSPWPTLLPFQDNWVLLPAIFYLNDDPSFTLTTLGQDVLARHTYAVGAGSSYYTERFNWSAAYVNDVWYPTFTLAGGEQALSYAFEEDHVGERRRWLNASATLPIRQRHVAAVAYAFERRAPLDLQAEDVLALGDFAWAEFGYRYRLARRFPYSVGDEHGVAVAASGRWYSEALGAEFNELLLNLDARAYLNNPLFDNHVLALRGVAAVAVGPDFRETLILGGAQGASLFTVQTDTVYPLRGFPTDLLRYPPGTGLAALYAEYRLPLWQVERGWYTLPVYLERLHLALFADAGNTFGNGSEPDARAFFEKAYRRLRGGRLGAGGELRADLSLGWAFPLSARLGVAWPLVERGRVHLYYPVIFVSFGTAI